MRTWFGTWWRRKIAKVLRENRNVHCPPHLFFSSFFVFRHRILLWSPDCPENTQNNWTWTCGRPPTSASQVLGWQAQATMAGFNICCSPQSSLPWLPQVLQIFSKRMTGASCDRAIFTLRGYVSSVTLTARNQNQDWFIQWSEHFPAFSAQERGHIWPNASLPSVRR